MKRYHSAVPPAAPASPGVRGRRWGPTPPCAPRLPREVLRGSLGEYPPGLLPLTGDRFRHGTREQLEPYVQACPRPDCSCRYGRHVTRQASWQLHDEWARQDGEETGVKRIRRGEPTEPRTILHLLIRLARQGLIEEWMP
jgi:hypothetical protein